MRPTQPCPVADDRGARTDVAAPTTGGEKFEFERSATRAVYFRTTVLAHVCLLAMRSSVLCRRGSNVCPSLPRQEAILIVSCTRVVGRDRRPSVIRVMTRWPSVGRGHAPGRALYARNQAPASHPTRTRLTSSMGHLESAAAGEWSQDVSWGRVQGGPGGCVVRRARAPRGP